MSAQTIGELFGFDDILDADEREIRDTVRRFGDEKLRPHVGQWFEEAHLPVRELAGELGELGLFGMHLTGYGCAGMSATTYGLACQELEAVDSGLRSFVSVQGSLAMFAIHAFGSDEQKDEWLPKMSAGEAIGCFGLTEADYGSNPGGMRTNAKRDGDDWVLNGSKMWITNAMESNVFIVFANLNPSQGYKGITAFIVEKGTPGFSIAKKEKKLGIRASSTCVLNFDDVVIPKGNLLGEEGQGYKYAISVLNEGRIGIAAQMTGLALGAWENAAR